MLNMRQIDTHRLKADNLKRIMDATGLEKKDFAERVNILEADLTGMIGGYKSIGNKFIEKVCMEFDILPIEFFRSPDEEEYKKPTKISDANLQEIINIYGYIGKEQREKLLFFAKERRELEEIQRAGFTDDTKDSGSGRRGKRRNNR